MFGGSRCNQGAYPIFALFFPGLNYIRGKIKQFCSFGRKNCFLIFFMDTFVRSVFFACFTVELFLFGRFVNVFKVELFLFARFVI